MLLHLEGDVDYPMVTTLIKAINELRENDNLVIYFTSPQGGLTDASEAIVDIINKHKERIGMIFYGEIFSSGMYIFLRTECEKYCLPDTRGMYHFAWQEITINEGGKPMAGYDKFCMTEMRNAKVESMERIKSTKLNQKEIDQIKKGKDVYFTHSRMLQLIDGTTK